jgi:perosamine synthetase
MGMIKLPSKSVDFFNKNYMEIFESGSLAEGKWNKKIQKWACDYTGAAHSQATCSNGSGILAILCVLKRYMGYKQVFIQSNTMYGVKTMAVTSGLEYVGEVPCSMPYLMPTLDQAKTFIDGLKNPQESVFLLTHIGGWTNPDIEKIATYCKTKGVALVEDCAHSLGSTMGGKHTGMYGIAGAYSLYATKAVPAGEGGIVVTNDDELAAYLSKFVIYDRFDQQMDIGVNIRLSELSALMVYAVLCETENIIANKYEIAKKYIEACKKNSLQFLDPQVHNQRSNLYKFILVSDNPADDFASIKTRTSPVYDYAMGEDSQSICSKHICLPIWYDQDSDVIEKVVSELNARQVETL